MSAPKKIRVTTPKGKLMWFKLTKPDQKFKKYQVDLILEDTPELRKLIDIQDEAIAARLAEELEKEKNPAKRKNIVESKFKPINEEYDSQGEPTGRFVIKFKAPSEGKNKEGQIYQKAAPAIFRNNGKAIVGSEKEALKVMNGSIGQVNFEVSTYFTASLGAGVSLIPKACMVHSFAEAGTDVSEYGFSIKESSEEEEEGSEDHGFESGASDDSDF